MDATHRCTGRVYPPGGEYTEPQVPCPAYRTADGEFHDTCGEPCRWIMIKLGEGNPPWTEQEKEAD